MVGIFVKTSQSDLSSFEGQIKGKREPPHLPRAWRAFVVAIAFMAATASLACPRHSRRTICVEVKRDIRSTTEDGYPLASRSTAWLQHLLSMSSRSDDDWIVDMHLPHAEQPMTQCMDAAVEGGRRNEREAACGAKTPRLRATPCGAPLWCPA